MVSKELGDVLDLKSVKSSAHISGHHCIDTTLRSNVVEVVLTGKGAGIDVVMITGDHPKTALAIASELGIRRPSQEEMITGRADGRIW